MARGITVMYMMLSITLSVSFLASVGAYGAVDAGTYSSNTDTNRIVETVQDQSGSITGVKEIDPFISLAVGASDTIQIFWIIITDTSELIVLLGAPDAIANQIETAARIAFGLSFAYLSRGVVL